MRAQLCHDDANPYIFILLNAAKEVFTSIKYRLKVGNCYCSTQILMSYRICSKDSKMKVYKAIIMPVVTMNTFRNLQQGNAITVT